MTMASFAYMFATAVESFLLYASVYSSLKALSSSRAVRTGVVGRLIPWPSATAGANVTSKTASQAEERAQERIGIGASVLGKKGCNDQFTPSVVSRIAAGAPLMLLLPNPIHQLDELVRVGQLHLARLSRP